jgi:UDP-galactopyranose mutase
MQYDYLIVGAGITGISMARVFAEAGKKVLIIDRRNHIGGNCYDEFDEHGVLIHKYGPHIFHTNYKEVWDFLSKFTAWRYYQHKVRAFVDGKLLPFPINLDTINQLYNLNLEAERMSGYLENVRTQIKKIENSRDSVLSKVGTDLYEKFFMNYTLKQWGIPPEELHHSVCERIPIKFNRDDRYFSDLYQGVPRHGYAKLFERMLCHAGIHLLLQVDYDDIADCHTYKALVCTGPIDEYFRFRHGKLAWRSTNFVFKNFITESFQDYAVINYPNDYDFTRISEYKKLTGQKSETTTVSFEYPCSEGEPFYPMPTIENHRIYSKYLEDAQKLTNVSFCGRLGLYRYINMDIACLEALRLAKDILLR